MATAVLLLLLLLVTSHELVVFVPAYGEKVHTTRYTPISSFPNGVVRYSD